MKDALQNALNNPFGIIVSIFIGLFALKEAVNIIKWFISWIKGLSKPHEDFNERLNKNEKDIKETRDSQIKTEDDLKRIFKTLDLLLESDRDDIKGYIVSKYYEVHAKNYIDSYSLDCLERRYKTYSREGGNTYIESLMNEIRRLPIVTPTEAVELERNKNRN